MIGHLRVRSGWSQLGILAGLLGAAFFLTSIFMVIYLLANGVRTATIDFTNPEMLRAMKWMQGISSITIFFLPAYFYARITFTGKYLYFLGLKPAEKRFMYYLSIVCILAAFPFVIWLGEINQLVPMSDWMKNLEKEAMTQMQAFLKASSTLDVIVNVFIIAFLPAICEELCFRGALQRILIQITKNAWAGIIVASILFSAFHFQFQGFLPRMFLGVVLGALFWYSSSLWPSIIAHFVNNAVQVVAVSYSPEYIDSNPQLPVFAAIISGLAVAAILYYYRKRSTASFAKTYKTEELTRSNEFIA
jgi:uncharacterized protein